MTSLEGVTPAVVVSAVNRHDVRGFLLLVFLHIPVLHGCRGRPRTCLQTVLGSQRHTSKHLLAILVLYGIATDVPPSVKVFPSQCWTNVAGRPSGRRQMEGSLNKGPAPLCPDYCSE